MAATMSAVPSDPLGPSEAVIKAFDCLEDEAGEAQADSPVAMDSYIDAHILEEERRLEAERAKAEEEQEVGTAANGGGSSQGEDAPAGGLRRVGTTSFSKLEVLLDHSVKFSELILEKMADMTMPMAAEKRDGKETAEEGEPAEQGSGKRKGGKGGRGKQSKKKPKKNDLTLAAKISSAEEKGGKVGQPEEEAGVEEESAEMTQAKLLQEQREIAPNLENCVLKPYQLKGVKWLISLWQNGCNGILADQMGLGKTVQTIAFLAHFLCRGMHGPFLVVAPLSTLSNWINEFNRFVPSAKVLLYHGTKEERQQMRERHLKGPANADFPVVVTSFEVIMFDRKKLQGIQWKYMVVDEGHRLKNANCKLIRELRQMQVENTLLLTGTPLQNNLTELWSLLNFILPAIFSDLPEFTAWFNIDTRQKPGSATQEALGAERRAQVVAKLHQILRPFLLRRIKADVEKSLPPKKEIILYAQMTPEQRDFHSLLIHRTLEEHLNSTRASYVTKKALKNVMIQSRKNCNHPDLLISSFDGSYLYPPVETLLAQCGKLQLLDRLLERLRAKGHKMLIFSQMTRLLDLLEYYLDERGFRCCRIDGSVKLESRREQIAEFNKPDSELSVFLLSTRAGGLGINLTAADTVIIYDNDWNPHCDMQAMDRCHRIGQTKPVHVYRLCTAHSIECRMLEVANSKLQLEHMVIEKGQFVQEKRQPVKEDSLTINNEELEALLRPKASAQEGLVQSQEISDENLELLLDRSEMMGASSNGKAKKRLPLAGPGWEVVVPGTSRSSLLSSIS